MRPSWRVCAACSATATSGSFWRARAASTIGDRIVFVALALYVTEIGSPSDVGIVLACHAVPLVGFLLIGGVWADRLPRHLVVVTTDLIRFGLHALLAALIFTGAVEVWHIAVIEALFGTAEAFFRPAFTGLVPQTVPEEEIQPAQAASAPSRRSPSSPGRRWPPRSCSASAPAGRLRSTPPPSSSPPPSWCACVRAHAAPGGAHDLLGELREGWAEFRGRTWIWVIVGGLLGRPGGRVRPMDDARADDLDRALRHERGLRHPRHGPRSRHDPRRAARLRWRPRFPMRASMLLALPFPIALGSFGLGLPIGVLVVIFVLAGTGIALCDLLWHTALAERVPPQMLSRVTAYDWMGSLALLPIGYVLAGPIGEAFGAVEVLVVGSVIALVSLAAPCWCRTCGACAGSSGRLRQPQRPRDEHDDVAADARARPPSAPAAGSGGPSRRPA